MKELILHLVKALAENPDRVELTATEDGDSVKMTLRVAEEDKGKIIGKQGKVIKALRVLAETSAAKTNRQVLLDLE